MSESDVIKVTIDDSELDAALVKIQQIVALSAEATATTGTTGGTKGLPGINREMRLILGQIPGMRQAIQVYFRLSRMVRGFQVGNIQLYLTLIATAIVVIKQLVEYQKSLERERQQYMEFIRRERRLTKREYEYLQAASSGVITGSGYGTAYNQYWGIPE